MLATGSVPKPIPGTEFGGRVIGTEEAWALQELPGKIAVVGAGASGAEIASAYGRLGTEVLLFEALDRVLPTEDADISKVAGRALAKQNMTIHTGTLVENVEGADDKVTFSFGDESGEVEWFIIAAGRGPDIEGLGLDEAGVKLDDKGLIEVDGALRTSAKGVYAIGDLVPGPALAHKASDEGVIAVEDAAGLETHPIEYIDIPRATFCTPNVGSFGLTEEQAREQGLDVVVGKVQYGAVGGGTVYGDRTGMVKIVGDKKYGEMVGGHIVGSRATELIQELVNAKAARGRLPRGRADHPRAPDAVRGRDGGRPGRRWLAHPRLSSPLLLRPRVSAGLSRGRAREPRARRGARVGAGAARRARAVPLRRGGRRLPRGRRARAPRARACRRSCGPTRSRPTASGRCWSPTYAKQIGRAVAFSLAAFRQAFAAGRDLSERDNVLIAAAACEMHPPAVIKGAELRGTRERLEAATERGARRGRARRPGGRHRAAARSSRCRREGQPRVRADRPPRRPRPGAAALARRGSTTSRSSRSTRARSCCSGTRRPAQTGRLSRALKADLAGLEADDFLARWRRYDPDPPPTPQWT